MEALIDTLRQAFIRQLLLTAIAAGLACYGIYCFVWALHPHCS
jgi:hypothetical protein